jgi:hypothetical protein
MGGFLEKIFPFEKKMEKAGVGGNHSSLFSHKDNDDFITRGVWRLHTASLLDKADHRLLSGYVHFQVGRLHLGDHTLGQVEDAHAPASIVQP